MWRKPSEFQRIKALRMAAADAIAQSGPPPPAGDIHLSLRVYARPEAGDLDNFITGICDSLMAANPRTPIDPEVWIAVPEEARPNRHILFSNDARIARIEAERVPPTAESPGYVLEVEFST